MQTVAEVDSRVVLSDVSSLWLKKMASGPLDEKCR